VSGQQWLNTSRQSVVPVWVVGKPAADLEAAITQLEPQRDDSEIHWEDTAIDGRHVTLTAEIKNKRITRLVVSTDDSNAKLAWDRLVAVYGKPGPATTHEDTVSWRWRRPAIKVNTFVGDMPYPHALPQPTPSQPSGFPITIAFDQ
jgi:hypothetical protein